MDFKYFNMKHQNEVNTFIPQEKMDKISVNQHKFADFGEEVKANNQ